MLASSFLVAVLVLLAFLILNSIRSLQKNIAKAKASGFNYLVAPLFIGGQLTLPLVLLFLPLARKLPSALTDPWIDVISYLWSWESLWAASPPFTRHGSTFLVASPGGLYMANSNPKIIHQIATRKNDFTKPIEHYAVIDIFGKNVVTSEGSAWRNHRKITSSSFNERSNALVWRESIHQAEAMLASWAMREGNDTDCMSVDGVYPDAATTSLHVVSRSGFGVRLLWPGEKGELDEGDEYEWFSSERPKGGHTMTFKESMRIMLSDFIWMGVFSKRTLGALPFKKPKKVYAAYTNFNAYLLELLELKKAAVRAGQAESDAFDLMVPMITASGSNDSSDKAPSLLSDSEIVGNAFVFLFAGHETTANAITFTLILLALNQSAQRSMQSDLDRVIGSKPPAEWKYPSDFNSIGGGFLGAAINEQLRLIPSVIMLPKRAQGTQIVEEDDGTKHVLPDQTFLHFCAAAVHRNTEVWPHKKSKRTGKEHDLDDFVPERWILNSEYFTNYSPLKDGNSAEAPTQEEQQDSPSMDIGSSTLFNPPPGAFIPFSDGPRACLGRRFATVELVAVLAVIFQSYSVELDVKAWATDEEVENMTREERDRVYEKASEKAWWVLEKGLGGLATLQQKKGRVGIRVVRRGKERFPPSS